MAEQNGKATESLNKGPAQDNGTSDEALLFDEATVLSRSEETAEEEQRFDNAAVVGKAQDSGNENIQTAVTDPIQLDQMRFGQGELTEEERLELQEQEAAEGEGSFLDPVAASDGGQQAVLQNDTPVQDTETQPADFAIENPDGTSEAAVDDLITPVEAVNPAAAEASADQPEEDPEAPQPPAPEPPTPEDELPDEVDVKAEINIDTIAGDDIINAEEADKEFTTITGTVGGDVEAGDEVTLTVNGNTYTGSVTGTPGNLTFSIPVKTQDLLADNSIDASVTASDDAGNTATATADRDITVDTEIDASITIDTIAGNDIIDATDGDKEFTTVTGTVGKDVQDGDTVTLTVNGNSYTGTVFENDTGNLVYSIDDVLTNDLEADNSIDASVTTTDKAGNTATADSSRTISLDGTGFGDAEEVVEGSRGADALSGNVFADGNHFGENPQIDSFNYTKADGTTGDADAGSTVTTLHGGELTVSSDGSWSYTPPVSGDHSDEDLNDVLAGAGFEYTASIDGGNTYTAEQAISVLDAAPEALEDTDTVTLNDDLSGSTTGNVMTGTGGHSAADLQADNEGPDTAQVTAVNFGGKNGTTVSFNNSADVNTDTDGKQFIEIEGDNGLLKLYQDGSYEYDVTDPITTKTVDDSNWDTVKLKAFNFGIAYKDSDGKLDLSKADGKVSDANNGIGVEGTLNGQVSQQINHNYEYDEETGATGESEALAIQFDNPITKATVSLSNLYKNDNGGEAGDIESGRWEAFDADGNLVGYGVLDDSTIDYTNGHQGTAVIELPGSGAFSTIVFSATAYDNPAINTDDSSDYFIQSISYEEVNTVPDQFTYQITDTDGDTSETTLTIDMTPPQAEEVNLPDLLDVTITIDPITGDDLLNIEEAAKDYTTITGTVGGDASEGDTITLTVNGNHYTGSVTEGKTYSIDVKTSDLQADNEVDASISIKNAAGLTATAKADRDISLEGDTEGFSFKVFAADSQGELLLDGDGNPIDATTISEPGTEGGEATAYYIVKAVDSNGIPLEEQPDGNIKVKFDNGSAENEDYTAAQGTSDFGQGAGTKTVAVNETFSATAEDDALADNGETFTVSLAKDSYTKAGDFTDKDIGYDQSDITTTIKDETATDTPNDNDSAFTLKLFASDEQGNVSLGEDGKPVEIDQTQIHEDGETSAFYVVKAVDTDGFLLADQPAGEVKVSFYNNNEDLSSDDYKVSGTEVSIGSAFSATAKNDAVADNGETFTVELVENSYSEDAAYTPDGAYETVTYDDASVTTTIRDLDIEGVEDNSNKQEGGADGDWDIPILQNLGDIHSSDEFASIKISGVPDGATLKGAAQLDENGDYVVNNWQDALNLTITPAVDSSADITLDYELSLNDGSVASFTQSIVITPEADQPWTLGKLGLDTVTYQDTLLEDSGWQPLDAGWSNDSDNFQELTASTGDVDGSEHNTVVRFFSDGDTNMPSGTKLRFENDDESTETFTFNSSNTYVDIPADKLDTLEIKTKANFNGELSLKIKTAVVDEDEDGSGSDSLWSDNGDSNQVWGEPDILKIQVSGDADLDANLISATSVIAPEDSGRNQSSGELTQNADGTYDVSEAIDLDINFQEGRYTNTEVIELKIDGIPADTFIFDKSGNLLNGDGAGGSLDSVRIVLDPDGQHYNELPGDVVLTSKSAFNAYVENLKLVPAHDSNEDFTLTLNQKSTEPNWDVSVGGAATKEVTDTFEVQLTSVADEPQVTGTDTPITLTESGEWQDLSGFQIASGEEQHLSEEVYALIRNVPNDVGLRIVDSNGTELFDQLVLANADSGGTDWRIDNETLQKINDGDYSIQLKTPDADYSGSIDFDVRVTVLDVDPDSGQETDTLISDYTMNIVVQPEVEGYGDSQSSGNEDEWIELGLTVGSSDGDQLVEGQYEYGGNTYDLKIEIPGLGETAEDIQIQGDGLVIDYANNLVYLDQGDLNSVEVLAPQHSNVDLSGIQFHRYLKDDMDDHSTSDEDIQEVVTGHTVKISGVADGWEDTDNVANGTSDDVADTDYDGFVVQDVTGGDSASSLADIIVRNDNIEDSYHEDTAGTSPSDDTSESEYYIIQNQSGAGNTTWMVEGGINAGGGVWVVPANVLDSANIKILQTNAGDGSLNLEIIPVSQENDGDILFDQAHTFTIGYTGGSEPIAGETGGSIIVDGSATAPAITVTEKNSGSEDISVSDVLSGTSASGDAELSYVVDGSAHNGSVDTSGMYQLPDGSYVGTGAINFNPDADFNGDAGFDVDIIATDSSGNQSFVSENITLDINPVLDNTSVSADGGTEINDPASEGIALNLQISSSDNDGSEELQGDVTITPQSGGALRGPGVVDNGDGSYTIAAEHLGSVSFVPDAYSHGTYGFDISYQWTDIDANGSSDVTEVITDTFSINLDSQVDQIDVDLTPTADIDEAEDYPLDLSVFQHDSDGSEIASVKISGIPDALVIHDASGNKIGNYSDNGDGTVSIVLKGSEVPSGGGLMLHDTTGTYGGEFSVEVSAFSFDKVTKQIEQGSDTVTLTINPVASEILEVDAGSAQDNEIQGLEDNDGMSLDLDVIMSDLDGSEKLKVTFGDEFSNVGFSAEYTDSNGDTQSLTDESLLTPEEAQSIKLIPQGNYSGDLDLDVHVQTVEVDENGDVLDILANAETVTVHVSVDPEADNVSISHVADKTVAEDASAVDVGLELSLVDSSELLNLVIEGLEPGSVVSVTGQDFTVGNSGSVNFTELTESEAESLSIQPPQNYSGTMNIGINVKTVDGDDVLDTAVTQSFNLEVTPVADDVAINDVGNSGAEDTAVGLGLDLTLDDSSELLNVTISGHEAGSVISIPGEAITGTVNGDGSVLFENLTLSQAESLQVTPPDDYSGTMNMGVSVKTVDGTDVLDTAVTQSFNLEVTPQADTPDLNDPLFGNEVDNGDGSFTYDLDLSASLTDDSEALSLRVDGIPDDCTLTNDNGDSLTITDGSITLTPDQLAGLRLTSPTQLVSDGDGGLHIEATAISTEDMDTPETDDDVSAIQTKTIIDGVIDGIAYTTSSGLSGLTDQHGNFQYREGDSVTFKVGDVVMGTATPDDLAQSNVFLQDLADVDRSDLNDEYVENMAVFLQSLDQDGNADNNITITPDMHTAFEGVSLDLRSASEEAIKASVEQAGKTAISEEQAMDHVQRMLEQYSGQTEFDAREDDTLHSASFAKAPVEGLSYETSSGLSGELEGGRFEYDIGDTVSLYAGDQLVAVFEAVTVGDDAVITFEEAGFVMSQDELSQLLNGDAPETASGAESMAAPLASAETAEAHEDDFGADAAEDEMDLSGVNDLFMFGEDQPQGLLDALENGVQPTAEDQSWFSQVESDQNDSDADGFGKFDVDSAADEAGYLSEDDQPCEW